MLSTQAISEAMTIAAYIDRQSILLTAEMSMAEAVEKLLTHSDRGAPVVNQDKQLVGFLSEQDCLAVLLKSSYHLDLTLKVSDCVQEDALFVTPETKIFDLAAQMLEQKPKIYPVVEEGKVIGSINRSLVLKALDEYMQMSYLQQT